MPIDTYAYQTFADQTFADHDFCLLGLLPIAIKIVFIWVHNSKKGCIDEKLMLFLELW